MYYLAKKDYDYAIRICAYIAGSGATEHFTIQRLSTKLLISKPFTTKIVYQLKKNKILSTNRGKNGGVTLAVNPTKLTFYQIFEAMGLVESVSACINKKGFCPLPPPCKIHKYFIDYENEIIDKLKNTTINNFSFSDSEIN